MPDGWKVLPPSRECCTSHSAAAPNKAARTSSNANPQWDRIVNFVIFLCAAVYGAAHHGGRKEVTLLPHTTAASLLRSTVCWARAACLVPPRWTAASYELWAALNRWDGAGWDRAGGRGADQSTARLQER